MEIELKERKFHPRREEIERMTEKMKTRTRGTLWKDEFVRKERKEKRKKERDYKEEN